MQCSSTKQEHLLIITQITGAVANFFYCMLLHPEVQEKLHEELDRVVGQDRLPTFDDHVNLRYLEAVRKEGSRWQPLTPTGRVLIMTLILYTYATAPQAYRTSPEMRTLIRDTFFRRKPLSLLTFGPSFAIAESMVAYLLFQAGMFSVTHKYGITQNAMIQTASFLRRIRTQRRCRIRGKLSLASEGVGALDSTLRMRCRYTTVQ
jgi:hypothetical protein